MNTKKAIESVKQAFDAWENEYCCGNEESKALYDELKQVIIVIEQGEKYKQIVEELEGIRGATEWEMVDLKEIKEQYYPKVVE